MDPKDINFILSIGISASLGATFGILRSKIFATKIKTTLYFSFYILAAILFGFAIYATANNWADSIVVIIISFVSSLGLAATTKYFLIFKDIYNTEELNPIVNNWTSNADRSEIKLFGGDLNFFGEGPHEMNANLQYSHLRKLNFNRISILCEEPKEVTKKIRYGKILVEMPTAELRFYNPEEADLRVRGRIIKVNGVDKLLVYNKIQSSKYQAIETDTANSNGALYNGIWELVWSLAKVPTQEQTEQYKRLFQDRG